MRGSWFPVLSVFLLLGLLAVLATLQYRWLGQISDGERVRLQNRLQIDTERFAEDFNREIRDVFHSFQLNADSIREKDWSAFNEQFIVWRNKANYPNLIENIYFAQDAENSPLLSYNQNRRAFEEIEVTDEIQKLREKFARQQNINTIQEEIPALAVSVFEGDQTLKHLLIRVPTRISPIDEAPKRFGVLIIKLNESVITNQIFPDLVNKYFSDSESANYKLAVTNPKESIIIYQTGNEPLVSSDATARLFSLSGENTEFLIKRRKPAPEIEKRQDGKVLVEEKTKIESFETRPLREKILPDSKMTSSIRVESLNNEKPRITIYEGRQPQPSGVWTLNVQHSAGSLEQFITNTRRKNLGISFGILSLLGVSIVLIFISAQRAQRFARKQIDFVSAVSHEFRTPLAVIYSAGENLTDGVINSEAQISKYGNLIKREGKKLSQMVEQILEFAGARSGRKKYDLRKIDVKNLVNDALKECQSLIEEKDFTVEREIAENLPQVKADAGALGQAIQNLLVNSIKYANGNLWLKVSAKNGGGSIKIVVEDKGIGISKKEISQIFQPFYRSKSVVDAQIHGNGLGLSLVKQTVEAHNGKISVESDIGKGSRFTIQLPLDN